jgi:hypothetical protein
LARNHRFKAACEVLGVSETASPDQLRQAYRDLVQIWHPDRLKGERLKAMAEQKLKEINEAYRIASKDEAVEAAAAQAAPRSFKSGAWTRSAPNVRPQRQFMRSTRQLRLRFAPLCISITCALILFTVISYVLSGPAELTKATLEAAVQNGPAGLYPAQAFSPFDDLFSGIESLATWRPIQGVPAEIIGPQTNSGIPTRPNAAGQRLSVRPMKGVEIESPLPGFADGVLQVENATEHTASLQLLGQGGYNLRSVTLEPDSTAIFRRIPRGRYFLLARAGNRIRRIGPFDYFRLQDAGGIRSTEYAFTLE